MNTEQEREGRSGFLTLGDAFDRAAFAAHEAALAATPASRVPLTDEQKEVEWKRLLSLSARFTSADWFEAGACFAEQHHGIGTKEANQ